MANRYLVTATFEAKEPLDDPFLADLSARIQKTLAGLALAPIKRVVVRQYGGAEN